MTTDDSFDGIRRYDQTPCSLEFWGSDTVARDFPSLRACVLFLADDANSEPIPSVQVHAPEGEFTVNGVHLEHLITAAKAARGAR